MEFTVSRADLVRELNLSQGVVEKKTTIPILSNVLVEADGDKIVLTATDLELGIRCSCPARVKKSGGGTIPARRLLDYVGLPFEAACLEFHRNPAATMTASSVQVRKPLYDSSLQQWCNYADELKPLRARLEAAGINLD